MLKRKMTLPILEVKTERLEFVGTKMRFAIRMEGASDFLKTEQTLFENTVTFEDALSVERALIFRNKRNQRQFIVRFPWAAGWEDGVFEGTVDLNKVTPTGRPLPMGYFDAFCGLVQGDTVIQEAPLGDTRHLIPVVYKTETLYNTAMLRLSYQLIIQYSDYSDTLGFHSLKLGESKRLIRIVQSVKRRQKAIRQKLFRFRQFVYTSIYNVTKWTQPLQRNKLIFASDSRDDISGNFAYILDEIKRRGLDLDIRFFFKPHLKSRRKWRDKFALPYHLATAKYVFVDDFYPMVYPLKIRRGTELVQVWHAVGAFKTFGYSRLGKPGGPSANSLSHRNYTKAIVSSKHVARHYAEGFGMEEDNVIATGIPRTDMFFDQEYIAKTKESLYEKYPLLKQKKVIMFAPTFRGNGARTAHYDFGQLDLSALYEAFHEEYVFVLKLHPFILDRPDIPETYRDFFLDLTDYREINELLFISDIMITDYSSTCFEFSLLKRPMLFFAYDLEDYIAKRDFYYDFESFVPGPIVRTCDELIERIQSGDFDIEKVERFANHFFEHQDGKSSERFVDQILLGKNS
ncbi:CDP-glycerol glycerophosphotransferase family protein [Exiguobacterium flavidum]|uniref:CDP-glycerol glycerophosphotransferase family protein n=1 Tax=Exiguobacterium flavidum TaxID=2184695 RepID=UPI001E58C353|nr:CDP-glycerol glycerophosphotransferase family protein [Exiguobacterium flavidum]